MSSFVVSEEGVIINRLAASAKRIAIAAWDLGSQEDSSFVSLKPDVELDLPPGRLLEETFYGVCSCHETVSPQFLIQLEYPCPGGSSYMITAKGTPLSPIEAPFHARSNEGTGAWQGTGFLWRGAMQDKCWSQ